MGTGEDDCGKEAERGEKWGRAPGQAQVLGWMRDLTSPNVVHGENCFLNSVYLTWL